jgi:4-alpha-glucanotransferase
VTLSEDRDNGVVYGPSADSAVLRLAREAGVLTGWVDAWGRDQSVDRDDLLAVLTALTGQSLESEAAVDQALGEHLAGEPAVESVIVAWEGSFPETTVPFGIEDAVIVLEDGAEFALEIDEGSVRSERSLPIGYHSLVINGGSSTSHVFSAPVSAGPTPSGALGLISPVYSLRSESHDSGIGTLAEFKQLADVCHATGVQVVGTLPLLSSFPDQPSPYAPATRRAWNEVFVNFSAIPGWNEAPPVGKGGGRWIDHDSAGGAIRASLDRYSRHVSSTPTLRGSVDAFLDADPEMRRYARFMATADEHGHHWRAWASSLGTDPERVAYHETVQWLMHSQLTGLSSDLRARGQLMYLDLPIGCHADGFDIWSDPSHFATASLGAPPDPLFVGGQDWGLPATIPSEARRDGHANFRKAIAKQLSVAGLLRIDHVMGILRTWWVPHGSSAGQGAYVMHAADEMFAVICIESTRANAGVVGENLGTVPPEIRQGLIDHRLLGMAGSHDTSSRPAATDLVAISTHDTPSFAAWWAATDIDELLELGVYDEDRATNERKQRLESLDQMQRRLGTSGIEATRDAALAWMAESDAAVALVNMDDLLMEERRQNVPGTDRERPNWRLRHDRTIDELAADAAFTDRLSSLLALRNTA